MKWRDVVNRFWEGKPAKGGGWCYYHNNHYRDRVVVDDDKVTYILHNSPIAIWYRHSDLLQLDDCGYSTPTTRDRLNAITPVGGMSVKDMMTFLVHGRDLYLLPVVLDVEEGRVLTHHGSVRLVPKLGRKKTERYGEYVTYLTGHSIVKSNGYDISLRRLVIFPDGVYAPIVGWNGRPIKWYGEYMCLKIDPAILRSDVAEAVEVEA